MIEYITMAAFFMHFGKDARIGEKAIDAHLRYFLSTGMDFVKIQFEQGYGRIRIDKSEDWEQIKYHSRQISSLQRWKPVKRYL
ncbi:MAG: hypothetical protein ACLSFW_13115 [Bacteroides cellulosilyticus]